MRAGGGRTPPRQLGGSGERRLPFLVCRYVSGTPSIYVSFLFYVFIGFNYFFLFNSIRRPPPPVLQNNEESAGMRSGTQSGRSAGSGLPRGDAPSVRGGSGGAQRVGGGGGVTVSRHHHHPPPGSHRVPLPTSPTATSRPHARR